MAKTSRDLGVNANPGGPGVSNVPNLGAATQSSNAWMGITSTAVAQGTTGSRPDYSAEKYGGDRMEALGRGKLFKGTSSGMDNTALKYTNAAFGLEKNSWNSSGQYGPGSPNYLAGGYGSREQMTIGDGQHGTGDSNKGKLVGDGAGATPETQLNQYFISGQMQVQMPKNQYVAGTDEARGTGFRNDETGGNTNNMIRSKRGLGKGYPRRDQANQNF